MPFPQLSQAQAALVFNALPGLGSVSFRRISDAFGGDLAGALSAGVPALARAVNRTLAERVANWRSFFDLEKEERLLAEKNARFVPVFDDAFPPLLKKIPAPPIGLYVAGSPDVLAAPNAVAIVGTRKASLYGATNARKFARELAARGRLVVSGGALGIDTEAHRGALEAPNGRTVAVLGCGIDIAYPRSNAALFREIVERDGALVSEFPLGRQADKQTFPQRNRVIAGLAAGTLVAESDIAGGSIITANFAAELGRTVFALPNRIDQPRSRGCHKLIREGATLVASVDDLLEDLTGTPTQTLLDFGENSPETAETAAAGTPDDAALSAESRKILSALADGTARTPDELSELLALPYPLVSANLLLLEIDRRVARRADGAYEIRL